MVRTMPQPTGTIAHPALAINGVPRVLITLRRDVFLTAEREEYIKKNQPPARISNTGIFLKVFLV